MISHYNRSINKGYSVDVFSNDLAHNSEAKDIAELCVLQ